MTFQIVCGAFWGDEGKGKIVTHLALNDNPAIVARAGTGPNAGHTIVYQGEKYKLRMIPSGFINPKARLLIGAGVLVNPEILLKEIKHTNTQDRIGVDFQAGIIEKQHIELDTKNGHLKNKIGTTGSGCGPANMDRALRKLKVARNIPELHPYLADVSEEINTALDEGEMVVAEGSQATFLSLYHGTYPYVTSHDTSAAGVCSDLGVGPTRVDEVIIVMKSFITRVGDGELPGELPFEELEKRGWVEYGTVTGRPRRAAPFNFDLARKAVRINGATLIALTKLDILYPEIAGATSVDKIKGEIADFIDRIEESTKVKVGIIGTGPGAKDIIDLRENI